MINVLIIFAPIEPRITIIFTIDKTLENLLNFSKIFRNLMNFSNFANFPNYWNYSVSEFFIFFEFSKLFKFSKFLTTVLIIFAPIQPPITTIFTVNKTLENLFKFFPIFFPCLHSFIEYGQQFKKTNENFKKWDCDVPWCDLNNKRAWKCFETS